MILGYSRVFGTALPLTGLSWNLDASDPSKIFTTFTAAVDPCWSVPTADGGVARVVVSTIPGPPSEEPLVGDGSSTNSPSWQQSAPALPLPDLLFDGINDRSLITSDVGSQLTLNGSSLLSASAKTMLVSFQIHAASLNNGFPAFNHPIIQDTNIQLGIFVRAGPNVQFYNTHDNAGTSDYVEFAISLDTNYVACYRHDGVNVYGSINGGTELSDVSGPTLNMGGGFRVGGDGSRFSNVSIGQILLYNAFLTGTTLTDAITYMTDKWLII